MSEPIKCKFSIGDIVRHKELGWEGRFLTYNEHGDAVVRYSKDSHVYGNDWDFHSHKGEDLVLVQSRWEEFESENTINKPSPMDVVDKMYEDMAMKDVVNHPDHYNTGGIECIEYLKDNMSWQGYTGYLEGNCKKYLHRWRYKQKPIEDLKKARWYLDRLIKELETEGNDD